MFQLLLSHDKIDAAIAALIHAGAARVRLGRADAIVYAAEEG